MRKVKLIRAAHSELYGVNPLFSSKFTLNYVDSLDAIFIKITRLTIIQDYKSFLLSDLTSKSMSKMMLLINTSVRVTGSKTDINLTFSVNYNIIYVVK